MTRTALFLIATVADVAGFLFTAYGLLRESFAHLAATRPFGEGRYGEGPYGGVSREPNRSLVTLGIRMRLLPGDRQLTVEDRRKNASAAVAGVLLLLIGLVIGKASTVLEMALPSPESAPQSTASSTVVAAPTSLSTLRPQESDRERVCGALGLAHRQRAEVEWNRDYTNRDVQTFYSTALDSCVHIEVAILGVEVEIRDLTHTILRDGGNQNVLLACDQDGANSVVLDAVRSHHGRVFNVPYREWLDDGFGGAPATLRTPEKPYTRSDCQRVLDRWMGMLRG